MGTSIEHTGADIGEVLGESLVLPLDLVGQLAGVAEDDDVHLPIHRLQLVQSGQHEDSRLAHT